MAWAECQEVPLCLPDNPVLLLRGQDSLGMEDEAANACAHAPTKQGMQRQGETVIQVPALGLERSRTVNMFMNAIVPGLSINRRGS